MAPYPGVELNSVYGLLERGYRMDCPPGCPQPVYRLMLQCWHWSPSDRPMMKDIHRNLESLLHTGIDEEVDKQLERSRSQTGSTNRRSISSNNSLSAIAGGRRSIGSPRISNSVQRLFEERRHSGGQINPPQQGEFPPPPPPRIRNNHNNNNVNANNLPNASISIQDSQFSTFRNMENSPPRIQKSYRRKTDQMVPTVPPASLKPKLLKMEEEKEGSSSPTEDSSLAEINIQKNLSKFGTLPKGQRIEAFLESIEKNPVMTDINQESTGSNNTLPRNGAHKYLNKSGHGSDDSLDAIPIPISARSHTDNVENMDNINDSNGYGKNELLTQLKERLKKTERKEEDKRCLTVTASPATVRRESMNGSPESISINSHITSTMALNSNLLKKPEPKPRKFENNFNDPIWKKKLTEYNFNEQSSISTTSSSNEPEIENELKTKIKQLRHVEKTNSTSSEGEDSGERRSSSISTNSKEDSSDGTTKSTVSLRNMKNDFKNNQEELNNSAVSLRNSKNEFKNNQDGKIKTQKVAPLQHHRPFSMQTEKNETPIIPVKPSKDSESVPTVSMQVLELQRQYEEENLTNSLKRNLKKEATLNSEIVPKPRKFPPADSKIPSRPSPNDSTTGSDEDSAIIRAQSLRDLTSKFEKLTKPVPTVIPAHRTVSEKRFSCFEPGIERETHHSTPANFEDGSSPTVSKEHLAQLYRRLETCITDLRNDKKSSFVDPDSEHHAMLIKLSDLMQQFHGTCAIYAENISPHSKFRYR